MKKLITLFLFFLFCVQLHPDPVVAAEDDPLVTAAPEEASEQTPEESPGEDPDIVIDDLPFSDPEPVTGDYDIILQEIYFMLQNIWNHLQQSWDFIEFVVIAAVSWLFSSKIFNYRGVT